MNPSSPDPDTKDWTEINNLTMNSQSSLVSSTMSVQSDYCEVENEATKQQENQGILYYMFNTSTFHAVSKIGGNPHMTMKVLWAISLTATSIASIYTLVKLGVLYFSWPVSTNINVAFSPLQLPAITVCNTNPIRLSRVNTLHCDLQAALQVDDQYRSPECIGIKHELEKNLSTLCSQFYWFCTGIDSAGVDEFSVKRKLIQLQMAKENRTTLGMAGHQMGDMLVSCNIGGYLCSVSDFIPLWNMEYGNCYTLNTTNKQIFDSGPPSGLDVVFNMQIDEFLQAPKTGYGMHAVVHEPGTKPFPGSEGLTVSAAVETHFGLRLVEIKRLSGLYGDCQNEFSAFDFSTDESNYKYSVKACRNLCLESKEIHVCRCADPLSRVATPSTGVKLCLNSSEFTCTANIRKEYMDTISRGENYCSCGSPCLESVYTIRSSSRKWPVPSYLPVLEENVCDRLGNETAIAQCIAQKQNQTQDTRESSFVRLRIYFETLNFEQMTQQPSYEGERYLSDIGGTLSLWIGASLLGMGELLEILWFGTIAIVRRIRRGGFFWWARKNNRQGRHPQNYSVTPTLKRAEMTSTADLPEVTTQSTNENRKKGVNILQLQQCNGEKPRTVQ